MQRRLPDDAFEYYVALGPERSYSAVAEHYGLSKRAITKAAQRQHWTERLERIERDAQVRVDQKLTETIEEQRIRHTKMLRAMASRAVKAIQEYPLTSGMEGLRAAEAVIKLERLLAGDATNRTELSVEQIVKREYEQFMVPSDADDEEGSDEVDV